MKKTDRRVAKTREALQKALIDLILEREYAALTVQDILDRANVGRTTFYSHFYDKDDLLHSEFEKLQQDFEEAFAEDIKVSEDVLSFSLVMFIHAKDYHAVYKAVVGKQGSQIMQQKIETYLKETVHNALKDQWKQQNQGHIPLEILENHLVHSFLQLMVWWLNHDLPHSPEYMDTIYRRLVGQLFSDI